MAPGRRSGNLGDHVLLPLVEADLAQRDGAHGDVDGGGDEAVDAHLVVQAVDGLRWKLTVERKDREGYTARRLWLFIYKGCQRPAVHHW